MTNAQRPRERDLCSKVLNGLLVRHGHRLSPGEYSHVNTSARYRDDMAQEPAKTLGERLRARRIELKMTQVQLSAKAKIGQPAISSIEAGDTQWVQGPNLLRLAVALDVDPDWLQHGTHPQVRHEIPDRYITDVWSALTPENRRRLLNISRVLLDEQTAVARKPTRDDPFPGVPKPPTKTPLKAKKS